MIDEKCHSSDIPGLDVPWFRPEVIESDECRHLTCGIRRGAYETASRFPDTKPFSQDVSPFSHLSGLALKTEVEARDEVAAF